MRFYDFAIVVFYGTVFFLLQEGLANLFVDWFLSLSGIVRETIDYSERKPVDGKILLKFVAKMQNERGH